MAHVQLGGTRDNTTCNETVGARGGSREGRAVQGVESRATVRMYIVYSVLTSTTSSSV